MLYKNNNFNIFIIKIMDKLLDGEERNLDILRKQYKNAQIGKIEFTGYGFYSSFLIPDNVFKTEKDSFTIDDVHIDVKGLSSGIGFVLFIRNGIINLLEGFTYGDEKWPSNIEIENISYIYPDKERNLIELKKNWT